MAHTHTHTHTHTTGGSGSFAMDLVVPKPRPDKTTVVLTISTTPGEIPKSLGLLKKNKYTSAVPSTPSTVHTHNTDILKKSVH